MQRNSAFGPMSCNERSEISGRILAVVGDVAESGGKNFRGRAFAYRPTPAFVRIRRAMDGAADGAAFERTTRRSN
jgi:hypothetical protein